MKKLTHILTGAMLCLAVFVAKADDATYVANWQFPIQWWFPNSPITPGVVNSQAVAVVAPLNFDALNCDFDAIWATNTNAYEIKNVVNNPESHKGESDFSASYKVFYDDDNMYVFLQYTDDDHTGSESYELMWAPYYKVDAVETLFATNTPGAQYCRFTAFGAYKATFSDQAFGSAMTIDFDASGAGNINWGGTPELLSGNLFLNDHTAAGSKVVKKIFTIGYAALTGEARPTFDKAVWKDLNDGRGISFDIKVNDNDTGEANTAGYWWNSTSNDGYALTYYSGFLGQNTTGIKQTTVETSIFKTFSKDQIELRRSADVIIFDAVGKQVLSQKNTEKINISNLSKGTYVLSAGGQIKKIVK